MVIPVRDRATRRLGIEWLAIVLFAINSTGCTSGGKPELWREFHSRIETSYDQLLIVMQRFDEGKESEDAVHSAVGDLSKALSRVPLTAAQYFGMRDEAAKYPTWRQDTRAILARRIEKFNALVGRSDKLKRIITCDLGVIVRLNDDLDGYVSSNVELKLQEFWERASSTCKGR